MHGEQQMKVTVTKERVLSALRANLAQHKIEVEDARKGFAKAAKKALEDELAKVGKGKLRNIFLSLTAPQNHTRDFESAIAMLEAHQGDTLELTQRQFETYVMNRWEWFRQYAATNSAYTGTLAPAAEDNEN